MQPDELRPVTFVAVWNGDKYPVQYLEIWRDMLSRNTKPSRAQRFVCITDKPDQLPAGIEALPSDPALPGWWAKLQCFKHGFLPVGRIAYFDLDVAITGELDTLVDAPGIIKDWNGKGYNSSVMVWDEGEHADIWARVEYHGADARFRMKQGDEPSIFIGDQDVITAVGGWAIFPEPWCVSYKRHATVWPTANSRVVCFHGKPKPHEITDGWVPILWKAGGLTSIPVHKGMNVEVETAVANFHSAIERDMNWFTGYPHVSGECLIVGSAPSVRECVSDIRKRHKRGGALVSMNGSLRWLLDKGLTPTSHVLLDGRAENIEFARDIPKSTKVLVASQCHPDVIDHLLANHPRDKVVLWHAFLSDDEKQQEALKPWIDTKPIVLVGGGCTVGLRAMYLAHLSGFRRIHCYGLDSCYLDDEHHAFAQPLNDGEEGVEILMAHGRYRCSYWMAKQAQQFDDQFAALAREGCKVWVHGRGLIPDMARILNERTWREAA